MDKFYNVLVTSLEMIRDRGFTVSKNDFDLDYNIFKYKYNLYTTSDSHDHIFDLFYESVLQKILVTYIKDDITIKQTVDFLKDEYELKKEDTLVLVLTMDEDGINLKKLKNMLRDSYANLGGCRVQVFILNELAFNITKHVLVPAHRQLSPIEVDKLVKKYSLTSLQQLPCLYSTDPVAKYYNFKKKSICEITRTNVQSGISKAYRLIV